MSGSRTFDESADAGSGSPGTARGERRTLDLRQRDTYGIDTAVSFVDGDRRIVGVVKTYRCTPTGRLYTVRADHDGRLTPGLKHHRLTPL